MPAAAAVPVVIGGAKLLYKGYKAYQKYKKLKKAKEAAEKLKRAKEAADKANKAKKKCKGNCGKKLDPRCILRPYKPDTCKPGRTGHHVVPDRVFRVGSRGSARIPGGISEAEGLVICVDGANLSKSKEHGKIHAMYDPAERAAGLANGGVAPLGVLEGLGVAAAAKVTGCDPKKMLAQLRAFHQAKGLGATTPVRADPTGKLPVNTSKVGTGATPKRGPKR
jgi:hypothetical protein